jgi:hypothetical protein
MEDMAMSIRFHGRLCGFLCDDCREPLSHVIVRVYRLPEREPTLADLRDPAVSDKNAFAPLDEQVLKRVQPYLAGEGRTDEEGAFSFELDEQRGEGPAVVTIEVSRVAGQPDDAPSEPRQFFVARLEAARLLKPWEFCLPHRFWCGIRSWFRAWVICGRVVVCRTGQGVVGVKVSAFDADWIQDDALGSAVTDATGHFRIYYTAADFKRTVIPWLHVDTPLSLVSGPDLYFHVHDADGDPMLQEDKSRGLDKDRANAPSCFCVELCVTPGGGGPDEPGGGPDQEPEPAFTHLGHYDHTSPAAATRVDVATGLTAGGGRAFFSTMPLRGTMPKHLSTGEAVEYRFEYAEIGPGAPDTWAWQPVRGGLIAQTEIGYLSVSQLVPGPLPGTVVVETTNTPFYVNGPAGAPNAVVGADGWIQAPTHADKWDPAVGLFVSNTYLLNLVSPGLIDWGAVDCSGLQAGESATAEGRPAAVDRFFSIRMRVRPQGDASDGVIRGWAKKVAIANTPYTNVKHHPTWGAYTQASVLGVCMLDIQQMIDAPCSEITSQLDVIFTAAHPNLGNVTISMTGPLGSYQFTVPGAGADRFGTAVPSGSGPGGAPGSTWTVAGLPPCAYIVDMSATLLLTTGESHPDPLTDRMPFCK